MGLKVEVIDRLMDGWLRLKWSEFDLILWAPASRAHCVHGHGHCDLGHFVLYDDGKPVLLESGRSSNRSEIVGRYGTLPEAHNLVLMNGCGPAVERHDYFLPEYRQMCATAVQYFQNEQHVRIEWNGFSRLRPTWFARRTVQLLEDGIAVLDFVVGEDEASVQTYFHFLESPALNDNPTTGTCVTIDAHGAEVTCGRGETSPPRGIWSPRYGRVEPCSTLVITQKRAALPVRNQYRIRVKSRIQTNRDGTTGHSASARQPWS